MGSEFRHNRAAYAREDVADSKRGRPEIDLERLAGFRGMRFRGSIRMGAFMSATPVWPDYAFNAMDGALPSGRYGLIEHELDEQPIDQDGIDQGGSYHSVRTTYRNPQSTLAFLTSGLFGGEKKVPNEAFAGNHVWLPASAVSVRVPEVNLIAPLDARRKDYTSRFGTTDLGDLGAPGFRATGLDRSADREAVAAALRGGAGEALGGIPNPYVRLEVGYGVVTVRRNGFASEDEISDLADRADRIAAAFAAACERLAAPQPFTAPVPDPPPPDPELSKRERQLRELARAEVSQAAAGIAARYGLTVEDPAGYHRAFPRLPQPGNARIVARGTLPGTGASGRIVYTVQGRRAGSRLRGGVLLAAPPGAAEQPLGGTSVEATKMYAEVVDGIVAVWDRGRVAAPDVGDLVHRAVAALRELGLDSPELSSTTAPSAF